MELRDIMTAAMGHAVVILRDDCEPIDEAVIKAIVAEVECGDLRHAKTEVRGRTTYIIVEHNCSTTAKGV